MVRYGTIWYDTVLKYYPGGDIKQEVRTVLSIIGVLEGLNTYILMCMGSISGFKIIVGFFDRVFVHLMGSIFEKIGRSARI